MEMTPVTVCNMAACAYNIDNRCHTPGITVGPHAECDTFSHSYTAVKSGTKEASAGVGACTTADCTFNKQLECHAPDISVSAHSGHPDCRTFRPKA